MTDYGLTEGEAFLKPTMHDPEKCMAMSCMMKRRHKRKHIREFSDWEKALLMLPLVVIALGIFIHTVWPPRQAHAATLVKVGEQTITAAQFCAKYGKVNEDARSFCEL